MKTLFKSVTGVVNPAKFVYENESISPYVFAGLPIDGEIGIAKKFPAEKEDKILRKTADINVLMREGNVEGMEAAAEEILRIIKDIK